MLSGLSVKLMPPLIAATVPLLDNTIKVKLIDCM